MVSLWKNQMYVGGTQLEHTYYKKKWSDITDFKTDDIYEYVPSFEILLFLMAFLICGNFNKVIIFLLFGWYSNFTLFKYKYF